MMKIQRVSLTVGALVAIAVAGCAAKETTEADAPLVDDGSLETATEGTSANGWSMWMDMYLDNCGQDPNQLYHGLQKSSGTDTTRGGGACYVTPSGSSCSSDAACITEAQNLYGSTAWGYCYSGSCYARGGSQADFCVLNPNRTSGSTLIAYADRGNKGTYGLGCMTKTAGPNTACGGTDTTKYMRYVIQGWWSNNQCW